MARGYVLRWCRDCRRWFEVPTNRKQCVRCLELLTREKTKGGPKHG